MGETAIASYADDCMDAGGSECLEHILERGFQSIPERNFLFLDLSKAKSVICYLGTEELGLSSMDIALRLKMSQPSVSKSCKRGRTCCYSHSLSINSF